MCDKQKQGVSHRGQALPSQLSKTPLQCPNHGDPIRRCVGAPFAQFASRRIIVPTLESAARVSISDSSWFAQNSSTNYARMDSFAGLHRGNFLWMLTCALFLLPTVWALSCEVSTDEAATFYRIKVNAAFALKGVEPNSSIQTSSNPMLIGKPGLKSDCFPAREYATKLLDRYFEKNPKENRSQAANYDPYPYFGNPTSLSIVAAVITGSQFTTAIVVEQRAAVCTTGDCDSLRGVRSVLYPKADGSAYLAPFLAAFAESRGIHGWMSNLYVHNPNHVPKTFKDPNREVFKCKTNPKWPPAPMAKNMGIGANNCFRDSVKFETNGQSNVSLNEFYTIYINTLRTRFLAAQEDNLLHYTWLEKQYFTTEANLKIIESESGILKTESVGRLRGSQNVCLWNAKCSCNDREVCRDGKGKIEALITNRITRKAANKLYFATEEQFETELSTILEDPSEYANEKPPAKVTTFEIVLSQTSLISLELWVGQHSLTRNRPFKRKNLNILWLVLVNLFSLLELFPVVVLFRNELEASRWITGSSRIQALAVSGRGSPLANGRDYTGNVLGALETNWVFRYSSTRLKLLVGILAFDITFVALARLASALHGAKIKFPIHCLKSGIVKNGEPSGANLSAL